MEEIADKTSIVVIGGWNPRIFSPDWVAKNLASAKEISVEVPVNNPTAPVRLGFDGLYLRILRDRLVASPQDVTDAALQAVEEVVRNAVTKLPHTPLSAIGVNFGYAEVTPTDGMLALFQLADLPALSDFGASVSAFTVQRALEVRNTPVNLNIDLDSESKLEVNFNFHHDVSNPEGVTAQLEPGVLHYRDLALEILAEVYGLQLD